MSALAEALQTDSLVGWWVTTTLLSLVVLAVAAVADLALRRFAAPGVRMALYVAVLVRVVLPADWHSPVGMVQTKIQASATVIDAPNPAALASTPASAPIVIEGETTAAVDASRPWLAYGLLGLWGLGGAGLLVVIARRLRAGRAIADAASHVATMDDTTIHVHPTAGPLVAGIVRPKIVVPAAMLDDVDPAVLRAVVRHEQAHVDHRDPWSTFALACFCALMWPVVRSGWPSVASDCSWRCGRTRSRSPAAPRPSPATIDACCSASRRRGGTRRCSRRGSARCRACARA
ncbi:MAG: M56 family metallopeptidase [Nannocystaceae bacterium]